MYLSLLKTHWSVRSDMHAHMREHEIHACLGLTDEYGDGCQFEPEILEGSK